MGHLDSGAPENASHFSAMTRPCWFRSREDAIEQHGARDFHTGHHQRPELPDPPDAGLSRGEELRRVGHLRVYAVDGASVRADAAPDALADCVSGQPDVSACARTHARPCGRNNSARRPRRHRDHAGRLVVVVGQPDTITTTASGNIIATICVVAAVLIVGAFVAGRRSVKTPAPARRFGESGRDASRPTGARRVELDAPRSLGGSSLLL